MLIICPSCATSYDVELASLQPNGRQVRCVRCHTVWHAAPSRAQKLLAAAAAIGPDNGDAEAATQAFAAAGIPAAGEAAEPGSPAAWPDAPPDQEQGGIYAIEGPADEAEFVPAAEPSDDSPELEAPPIAPVDFDDGQPPVTIEAGEAALPAEDVETYAARRQRSNSKSKPWRWPLSKLQSAILALLIADAIIVGWRVDFVRILPQTASLYARIGLPVNVRGLAFDGITINTEQHEGVPILVVEGSVINGARQMIDVPRLKFGLRNAAGQEIYSWTAVPPHSMLPPGEAMSFRTRLASPPPEGRDVLVRFVNRRDIIAGAR